MAASGKKPAKERASAKPVQKSPAPRAKATLKGAMPGGAAAPTSKARASMPPRSAMASTTGIGTVRKQASAPPKQAAPKPTSSSTAGKKPVAATPAKTPHGKAAPPLPKAEPRKKKAAAPAISGPTIQTTGRKPPEAAGALSRPKVTAEAPKAGQAEKKPPAARPGAAQPPPVKAPPAAEPRLAEAPVAEAAPPTARATVEAKTTPTAAPIPPAEARRPSLPERAPRPMAKAETFAEGDHVVYPTHGVGKVERIVVEEIAGQQLELIHITFEENRMTLRVPVAKARSAGLRKLATRKLFDEAMAVLKGRARIKRTMWSRRAQEYEAKINSGDPLAIAEVVRDLHRNAGQPDQSFSERQIYEAAMDRLAAELAALDKTDKATASTKLVNFLKTL